MSTQTKSSSRPWLVFIGCCVLSLVGFGLIVNTPGLYFTVLGETLNVSARRSHWPRRSWLSPAP